MDITSNRFDHHGQTGPSQPRPQPDEDKIARAAELLLSSHRPVIRAGGGIRRWPEPLRVLAEKLDAPVDQTVNARGLLHGHPLGVAASPSLQAARDLIGTGDVALAVGTVPGPTDYDMYATGTVPQMRSDPHRRQRRTTGPPPVRASKKGDAAEVLSALGNATADSASDGSGAARAEQAHEGALAVIGPDMRVLTRLFCAARDAVPQALLVGDSARPIYAGNLCYDHGLPCGWFNAATGYGALGYGISAAIGAALAVPDAPVICITDDWGRTVQPSRTDGREGGKPVGYIRHLEQSGLSGDRDINASRRRDCCRMRSYPAGIQGCLTSAPMGQFRSI